MKNTHNMNYHSILSGAFYVEKLSISHNKTDSGNTYIRFSNEQLNDVLMYISNGECTLDDFDKNKFVAKKGSVVHIPHNIAYKIEWSDKESCEIYIINYLLNDSNQRRCVIGSHIHLFEISESNVVFSMFETLYSTYKNEDFGYALKCNYLFLELLYNLIRFESRKGNSKISKAIDYIEANYTKDFEISKLCSICNLGECMLRRYFKSELGMSPIKYKNNLRIKKAYEMLSKESYSVTEVMEHLGFYDASYFNKVFKSITGKTPSECKNED